jgi:phosphate transport system protein
MHTDPPPRPDRDRFHDTLEHLEENLQAQAAVVRAALARATRGLVTGNTALCGAVVAGDDEVDRRYLDIERQVVDLLGHHAPVASDRRLLTAILHVNLHLERIGDMAVNVARLGQVVADAPRSRRWTRHLEQMSENAVWMLELAMQAFGARDAPGSQRLPTLDAQVDELNRSLLAAVLHPASRWTSWPGWYTYTTPGGSWSGPPTMPWTSPSRSGSWSPASSWSSTARPQCRLPRPERPRGCRQPAASAGARTWRVVWPYRAWLVSGSIEVWGFLLTKIEVWGFLLTKGVLRCRRGHGNGAGGWGCGWPPPWSSAT